MLLKRKIVEKPLEVENKRVNLNQLMSFQKELSLHDPKHHWGIIRAWNEKLFNEFPSPEIHPQMLELRIQYELVKRDYDSQGVKLPPRLAQNYIASKHYEFEKLVPSLKAIMGTLTKGETMSTTVKKAVAVNRVTKPTTMSVVSKVSKETVTQTYTRIFQENATKKLNDVALAAEMVKVHPNKKKYSVADIKSVRSMYNRGALSGQKGKPPVASFVVAAK